MYYDILKASKVKAEVFPDYWTLLWGRKMSASMIKTITGVLPLTFTAKGGTAVDWVIYGNDDNGTEQLMNCSTISGGVLNEYGVVIGADATTNIHADNGSISFTTGSKWRGIVTDFTEIKSDVENVTLTYSGDRAANWRFCFYDNSQTFISQSPDIDRQTRVVDIPNNTKYFRVSAQFETAGTYSLTSLSIVKGSTAPDHYIPYQQGVGERTAQLFPDTVGKQVITAAADTVFVTSITNPMTLAAGRYTIHYYQSTSMTSNTRNTLLVFAVATGVQTYESSATNHNLDAGWYSWTFDIPNDGSYQIRIWINNASDEVKATNFILTKGETATPTEYIPHGYQIPLTVSQKGQPDKTYDIYIGDSPLTEGETVSKTSTGVDIELFEGENVVSTTLYNKPAIKIKYK